MAVALGCGAKCGARYDSGMLSAAMHLRSKFHGTQ
jgi:hypothetical protein